MSKAATRSMICSSSLDSANTEPHPLLVAVTGAVTGRTGQVTVRGAAGQTSETNPRALTREATMKGPTRNSRPANQRPHRTIGTTALPDGHSPISARNGRPDRGTLANWPVQSGERSAPKLRGDLSQCT